MDSLDRVNMVHLSPGDKTQPLPLAQVQKKLNIPKAPQQKAAVKATSVHLNAKEQSPKGRKSILSSNLFSSQAHLEESPDNRARTSTIVKKEEENESQ